MVHFAFCSNGLHYTYFIDRWFCFDRTYGTFCFFSGGLGLFMHEILGIVSEEMYSITRETYGWIVFLFHRSQAVPNSAGHSFSQCTLELSMSIIAIYLKAFYERV